MVENVKVNWVKFEAVSNESHVTVLNLTKEMSDWPSESGYYPVILKSGSALLVFWDNVFHQWERWYDQEVRWFLPVVLPNNPMDPREML
jgi:hypothetical protein